VQCTPPVPGVRCYRGYVAGHSAVNGRLAPLESLDLAAVVRFEVGEVCLELDCGWAPVPFRRLVFEAQSIQEPISGHFRSGDCLAPVSVLSRLNYAAVAEVSSCCAFAICRSDWRCRDMVA
jgi:hypothetical protein